MQVHQNILMRVNVTEPTGDNERHLLQGNRTGWLTLNRLVKQVLWALVCVEVYVHACNWYFSWIRIILSSLVVAVKVKQLFSVCSKVITCLLHKLWHPIWLFAFRLVYISYKIVLQLVRDIANLQCLPLMQLFVCHSFVYPLNPSIFQGYWMLFSCHQKELMKVLLFWRRTEYQH